MKIKFCYHISKDANMAQDDAGNPADCFSQFELSGGEGTLDAEKYKEVHAGLALNFFAREADIDPKHLKPISISEYNRYTEGEPDRNE
jgi:hypothetical protein